jgi:hypothetical protein
MAALLAAAPTPRTFRLVHLPRTLPDTILLPIGNSSPDLESLQTVIAVIFDGGQSHVL